MKLKRIKKFIAFSLCVLVLTFISCLFQGCEKEEIFDLKREVTKEDIINLANKHGIQITINNSTKNNIVVSSLEELERIFVSIEKHRQQSISKKLTMIRNGNLIIFEPKQKMELLPRLKSGNESAIWGESAWFFNLTWLSSYVGYQSDSQSVTITSSFSGISLWNYVQDQSTYYHSGDTIHYQFNGTATLGINIGGFGIQSTSGVSASGWVNTSTGEGELSITTNNGYWYDN